LFSSRKTVEIDRSFRLLLTLDADGFARAFASACVGLGALAANRQATTVANATVATDFYQTLNRAVDFAAQITFDAKIALDDFTKTSGVGFAEVANTNAGVDTRNVQNLPWFSRIQP
jgi:hypothetical protein